MERDRDIEEGGSGSYELRFFSFRRSIVLGFVIVWFRSRYRVLSFRLGCMIFGVVVFFISWIFGDVWC